MNLNVEYIGDINYRVIDLVFLNPNKSILKKKFVDYILEKTS